MKKTAIIFTLIIISIFITACSKEATPDEIYADAMHKYEAAEFEEAKELFSSLDGYKDSDEYFLFCDLMINLQGRYVTENGSLYFTIIDFKVLDWSTDECIIEVVSSKEINFIRESKYQKFTVIYEDSKMALKGNGGLVDKNIYSKIY